MPDARGHTLATSSLPGCLLLPWSLPRRHTALTPSHFSLALWTSLPLAPLFPSRDRAELAVIVAVPMATGHP